MYPAYTETPYAGPTVNAVWASTGATAMAARSAARRGIVTGLTGGGRCMERTSERGERR
jgi:hypothetical protein